MVEQFFAVSLLQSTVHRSEVKTMKKMMLCSCGDEFLGLNWAYCNKIGLLFFYFI